MRCKHTYSSLAISETNKMRISAPAPKKPPRKRAHKMKSNEFPKKINSQTRTNGIVKERRVLFDPTLATIQQREMEPKIPPKQLIDPAHEISLGVRRPEISGVSSDDSIGRAGLYQPIIHPCDNATRFAVIQEKSL